MAQSSRAVLLPVDAAQKLTDAAEIVDLLRNRWHDRPSPDDTCSECGHQRRDHMRGLGCTAIPCWYDDPPYHSFKREQTQDSRRLATVAEVIRTLAADVAHEPEVRS